VIYWTAQQILFLHARLVAETGGSQGVRDLGLLLSAVGRPMASFEEIELYPDIFSKSAALIDSLIRNHPFVDGNKRTGISAAILLLRINGYRLNSTDDELVDFTIGIAKSEREFERIVEWIQAHALPLG
jgi:death on curing protein